MELLSAPCMRERGDIPRKLSKSIFAFCEFRKFRFRLILKFENRKKFCSQNHYRRESATAQSFLLGRCIAGFSSQSELPEHYSLMNNLPRALTYINYYIYLIHISTTYI